MKLPTISDYQKTNIRNIRPGDVVLYNMHDTTVGVSDIRYSPFMGLTLFGDCYALGTKPVMKRIINTPKIPLTVGTKP